MSAAKRAGLRPAAPAAGDARSFSSFAEAALACLEGRKPFPGRPVRAPLPARPHATPCACEACQQWARAIVAAPRLHPEPAVGPAAHTRAWPPDDAAEDDPEHDYH